MFRDADGPAVAEERTDRDRLAAGATWQFAVVFGSVDAATIPRSTAEPDYPAGYEARRSPSG